MKTTLDVPDEILKNAEASASRRGETLGDYVTAALESRLEQEKSQGHTRGWRSVFGAAHRPDVDAVDEIVARDLETIIPGDWR